MAKGEKDAKSQSKTKKKSKDVKTKEHC